MYTHLYLDNILKGSLVEDQVWLDFEMVENDHIEQ